MLGNWIYQVHATSESWDSGLVRKLTERHTPTVCPVCPGLSISPLTLSLLLPQSVLSWGSGETCSPRNFFYISSLSSLLFKVFNKQVVPASPLWYKIHRPRRHTTVAALIYRWRQGFCLHKVVVDSYHAPLPVSKYSRGTCYHQSVWTHLFHCHPNNNTVCFSKVVSRVLWGGLDFRAHSDLYIWCEIEVWGQKNFISSNYYPQPLLTFAHTALAVFINLKMPRAQPGMGNLGGWQ